MAVVVRVVFVGLAGVGFVPAVAPLFPRFFRGRVAAGLAIGVGASHRHSRPETEFGMFSF